MEHTTFRTEIEQRIAYLEEITRLAPIYEGRQPDYWDGKLAAYVSLLDWLNDYIAHSNGQQPDENE